MKFRKADPTRIALAVLAIVVVLQYASAWYAEHRTDEHERERAYRQLNPDWCGPLDSGGHCVQD